MTCTWLISPQFGPITTFEPTMQYGPMIVPSPIPAPSSTRAVGSIAAIRTSSVGQHRADAGVGDNAAVHLGLAVKPPHGLAAANAAHVVLDGVARHHRLAKFAFVDG